MERSASCSLPSSTDACSAVWPGTRQRRRKCSRRNRSGTLKGFLVLACFYKSLLCPDDQILQFPIGHMMYGLHIPVVLDVSGGTYVLQHHFLCRHTQSDHKKDFHIFRYFQFGAQLISLHITDETSSQPLFRGTQQDALTRDAVVAEKIIGDAPVAQDDYVGSRPLPFAGPAPIFKISGPAQTRQDGAVFLRRRSQLLENLDCFLLLRLI
jgi:hypothetical protein